LSISVENKIALVTGANRGIGKAIVESFIEHGAKKVYLAVRNPDSTKALEEEFGAKVVTLQADISDADSVKQLAEQAADVDIVVNNAGVLSVSSTLGDDAESKLARELNVNVFGLLRVANAFAEILEKNKGALVQLNSVASLKSFPNLPTYSASKAASYSLTQGLKSELGKKGVCVLSVHPGPIATDMADQAGMEESAPVSAVSGGIVSALAAGDFHLFPDDAAKQFEAAYRSFSDEIVMSGISE